MRIRTQIILAAFLLAVVPLTAIVSYSYRSSRKALEDAYRQEAQRTTRQMDERLASIRAELDQRMTFVSALPVEEEAGPGDVGSIVTAMGEAASLVDALEFQPVRPQPVLSQPETPRARPAPEPPVVVTEATPERSREQSIEQLVGDALSKVHTIHTTVHAGFEPIVIDLPQTTAIVRHVISDEQMALAMKVASLGAQMSNTSLPPEVREELRKEMQEAQRELQAMVKGDAEKFRKAGVATVESVRKTELVPRTARVPKAEDSRRIQEITRRIEIPQVRPAGSAASIEPHPSGPEGVPAAPAPPTPATAEKKPAEAPTVREATPKEIEQSIESARRTALLLGRNFEAPLRKEGEVVGSLSARVSPEEVIRRVLGQPEAGSGEIPFAFDREGTLYTRSDDERRQLEALNVPARLRGGESLKGIRGWVISSSVDPQSGLRIGVARRCGENLDELRRAAAKNLGLGLGLIAFALIGIVPLSNHLTRDVKLVTTGAERIAHGDLLTRLPVKTDNELGQLAKAFNRMAEDLSVNQQKLVEQERARKEQEIQQRLLEVEYQRKSVELEEARRFQLSMLPKVVPQHERLDVAVFTKTATEVGGDYYDFHESAGRFSVTIGDATGHGAKAGTMVTVVKTLFAGYNGETSPSAFLRDAAERIRRMDLGRMAMALSLGRFEGSSLTLASAGMPPLFVHRSASGSVEEIGLGAKPLGTMETDYPEIHVTLQEGDTVLFLTDGFPELMNDAGQQLGYAAALEAFGAAAVAPDAEGVIARLAETARRWHGETAPNDDVTFVVVRVAAAKSVTSFA